MSINIKTDPLRSAILFGRPVLFASQRIPREEVPEGWYYYELRGSVRNAKKPVALSDHAYVNPIGSVLSPVPLKRDNTISRRVNGQFLLLGETTTLRDYCWNNGLEYPFPNQTFAIRPASPEEAGIFLPRRLNRTQHWAPSGMSVWTLAAAERISGTPGTPEGRRN